MLLFAAIQFAYLGLDSGFLALTMNCGEYVRTIGKGGYFGEQELLFDSPRLGTICDKRAHACSEIFSRVGDQKGYGNNAMHLFVMVIPSKPPNTLAELTIRFRSIYQAM